MNGKDECYRERLLKRLLELDINPVEASWFEEWSASRESVRTHILIYALKSISSELMTGEKNPHYARIAHDALELYGETKGL